MKIKRKEVSMVIAGTAFVAFLHIVELDENQQARKVVDIFREIKENGYQEICHNGTTALKNRPEARQLLVEEGLSYIVSMKDDLNDVKIIYPSGIKHAPIAIVGSDKNVVSKYMLEPGCTIAVLSGPQVA